MPEMNLYLCGFFLGNWNDGMGFVLHKSSFVSVISKHCLQFMSLFNVEVRERLLEQTTKVKVACFCLLMKPQHWCFCLNKAEASRARPWSTAGAGNFSYPGEKTALFLCEILCSVSALGKQRAVHFLSSLPSLVCAFAARWTKNAPRSKGGNVAFGNCWEKSFLGWIVLFWGKTWIGPFTGCAQHMNLCCNQDQVTGSVESWAGFKQSNSCQRLSESSTILLLSPGAGAALLCQLLGH